MVEINIEATTERAVERFLRLAKRVNDMSDIWKTFLDYMKDTYFPAIWETKGKILNGGAWEIYSPRYKAWKKKKTRLGTPNLILTGRLRKAFCGGAGWYEKIEKKKVTFGARGIPYANAMQYGLAKRNIKARPYFFSAKRRLAAQAYKELLIIIDNDLMEKK